MSVTIYHNPRCSKSRQTLALLEERGQRVDLDVWIRRQSDRNLTTVGWASCVLPHAGADGRQPRHAAGDVR